MGMESRQSRCRISTVIPDTWFSGVLEIWALPRYITRNRAIALVSHHVG